MGKGTSILPQPLDVGWTRRCPLCRRAFALQLVSAEERGDVRVEKFRCKYCQHEAEFGDRLPRRVI